MVDQLFRCLFKRLYRPMLLVALGIHAVLLLLPLPQPKDQEPKTVKLTALVAPRRPTAPAPKPTPPKPPSKPTVQGTKAISSTKAKGRVAPVLTPVASPLPTPTPTSTTPAASPTPTPAAAAASVSEFLGQLASSNDSPETSSETPSPDRFTDPSLFFDKLPPFGEARLKPDILRAAWMAGKTPAQVYVEILVTQGQRSNFQVSERGTYSQGTVYEVKQGTNTWYFNLVPAKKANGTVIVVWQHDPSVPLR